jgi:hypothetical protein
VHARDRIGPGPWYDRNGRLLARNLTDLFAGPRPMGEPQLVADITNERGEPNYYVGANGRQSTVVDNHDMLTGSDTMGACAPEARPTRATTGRAPPPWGVSSAGTPGHALPRAGSNWASDH